MSSSFLLLTLVAALAAAHTCVHDAVQRRVDVKVDEQIYPNEYNGVVEGADRKRQSGTPAQGLRVHFDTYNLGANRLDCRQAGQTTVVDRTQFTCSQEDVLDQATKNVLLRVLADLKTEVESMFSIIRPQQLTVSGTNQWCHDSSIDMSKYGSSSSDPIRAATDLVVVVTGWPTEENVLAWCSYCRTDQFGRPIAAHINFGPAAMFGKAYKYIYATALHELFHGMGFTSTRMNRMLNANGQVFSGVTTATLGSSADGTKQVNLINSPRVLAEARAHFGCPSLAGLEVEDNDGERLGSHWESRVMTGDVQAPQIASDSDVFGPRVSRMTLAFFEDLGVYRVDYRTAAPYAYGRGLGCAFAQQPARTRIDAYQCPRNFGSNHCNPQNDGYSSCQWFQYSEDISLFERPDPNNPRMGGSQYADYSTEAGAYRSCADTSIEPTSGQFGGAASMCIYNTITEPGWTRNAFGAGCYETRCPTGGYSGSPDPEPPAPTAPAPTAPAPTAAVPTAAAPTSAPTSVNFRAFTSCELCARNNGLWCDAGWNSLFNRNGVCANPDTEQCGRGLTEVTSEDQCYPPCTFGSLSGECRSVSYCAGRGGASRSSRSGADGCQSEPGAVMCCILPNKKRSAEEVAEEPVHHEKRQSNSLEIRVGNKWVQCPAAGGDVVVGTSRSDQFNGKVRCPSLQATCCPHLNYCNGNGRCVNGACVCKKGYTGDTCTTVVPAPVLSLPSREGWRVNNFVLDEVSPIDSPRTPDGQPLELDDSFGGVQLPGETGTNGTAKPDDAHSGIDVPLVVGIAVAVVLLFALAVAIGFFLFRFRRAQKRPQTA